MTDNNNNNNNHHDGSSEKKEETRTTGAALSSSRRRHWNREGSSGGDDPSSSSTPHQDPSHSKPPTGITTSFLERFQSVLFGIVLGCSAQSINIRALVVSPIFSKYNVSDSFHVVIWLFGVVVYCLFVGCYFMKWWHYSHIVYKECGDPIRANFLFAVFVAPLFLISGVPTGVADYVRNNLWSSDVGDLLILLFLGLPLMRFQGLYYTQWILGSSNKFSLRNSNPTYQIALIGSFIFPTAMNLSNNDFRHVAFFFWSCGLIIWIVLIVCLFFQMNHMRNTWWSTPGLRPTLFLFVAPPAAAASSIAAIQGEDFTYLSEFFLYISWFMFLLMVSTLIKSAGTFGCSFSWWAIAFPTVSLGVAMTKFSSSFTWNDTEQENDDIDSNSFPLSLEIMSLVICVGSFVYTILLAIITAFRVHSCQMLQDDPFAVNGEIERKSILISKKEQAARSSHSNGSAESNDYFPNINSASLKTRDLLDEIQSSHVSVGIRLSNIDSPSSLGAANLRQSQYFGEREASSSLFDSIGSFGLLGGNCSSPPK